MKARLQAVSLSCGREPTRAARLTAVEAKLEQLQASLPEGVEIVTTYDRSQLIDASVENLTTKLIEEFIVVASCASCSCGTRARLWSRL